MLRVFGWLVVLGLIFYGYQQGWFNGIINYFETSAKNAKEERVIEHEDGSITTVKYRNVFQHLLDK